MRDDWRIDVEVEEEQAHGLLDRLRAELGGDARELARELERRRLAVSQDDERIFVYAGSRSAATAARELVEAVAAEHGIQVRVGPVARWLPGEERWDHDDPGEDVEDEVLERGFAPWEVRIPCRSRQEARELADRLQAEGYGVMRRWRYVLAGVEDEDDARALARRLHGEVEVGGELVWETMPGNPFAVFGGMGGL
jgi:hypothetical protein